MFRRVPPAFVVAAFVGMFGAAIAYCADLVDSSLTRRSSYFRHGLELARGALITAGILDLARRSTGAARWLAAIAGRVFAVDIGWSFVRDIWEVRLLARVDEAQRDQMIQLYDWNRAAFTIATIAAAAAITYAVAGWRRAPIAALLYLLAVCGRPLWWYFFPGVFSGLDDEPFRKLYVLCLDVVSSAALLRMLVVSLQDGASPAADPPAAARGFRIAAVATWCAIVVAIALFVLDTSKLQAHATIRLYGWLAPIGCTILGAAAILRVVGSGIDGLPTTRLALGAAAVLWWVRIDFLRQLRGMDETTAWSTSGPLIAAGGTILIGSAIAAYARSRQDRELHPRGTGQIRPVRDRANPASRSRTAHV